MELGEGSSSFLEVGSWKVAVLVLPKFCWRICKLKLANCASQECGVKASSDFWVVQRCCICDVWSFGWQVPMCFFGHQGENAWFEESQRHRASSHSGLLSAREDCDWEGAQKSFSDFQSNRFLAFFEHVGRIASSQVLCVRVSQHSSPKFPPRSKSSLHLWHRPALGSLVSVEVDSRFCHWHVFHSFHASQESLQSHSRHESHSTHFLNNPFMTSPQWNIMCISGGHPKIYLAFFSGNVNCRYCKFDKLVHCYTFLLWVWLPRFNQDQHHTFFIFLEYLSYTIVAFIVHLVYC